MPAKNPSMAYFGDDLMGAAMQGGGPWAGQPGPAPIMPPAGVLHDPNVVWLDPGMLMEPGTGFGSAQKDMLGQSMAEAEQFLQPGGGGGKGGGGGVDVAGVAGQAVDVAKQLSETGGPAAPGAFGSGPVPPGVSFGGGGGAGEIGLGDQATFETGTPFQLAGGGLDAETLRILGIDPALMAGDAADIGMTLPPAEMGQQPGLNFGGALLPAAGAGLSAYGAYQGLTSGDTAGQIQGAGQGLSAIQQAMQAYDVLTGAGAGAAGAGAAGGASAAGGLAAAGSAMAPVVGYVGSQPVSRTQFYNSGERNTAAVTDALASIAAPFTFGMSVPANKAIQMAAGMGREGKEAFQRAQQSSELMGALMRGLEGISPETWGAAMDRPVYMAHPELGVDYGAGTVSPWQRETQTGGFGEHETPVWSTPGRETLSLSDPRGRAAAMPLAGQSVGSLLASLAADPAVGYGEFGGGAYDVNPLINLEGAGKSGYGRIGSVAEMVSKIAASQDDAASMGGSRYAPILDMLSALDSLRMPGTPEAAGPSPADLAERGITGGSAAAEGRGGPEEEELMRLLATLTGG